MSDNAKPMFYEEDLKRSYRRIVEWVSSARRSGWTSFVDAAFDRPDLWMRIQALPGVRVHSAIWLGWQRDATVEQILTLHDRDLASILLCHPILDAYSAWVQAPMLCHRMHVCGRLAGVFRYLDYRVDEPDDLSIPPEQYDLDVLKSGKNQDAMLTLHIDMFDHAHRHGLSSDLISSMEWMPDEGWPTRGGPVYSVMTLMLARLLESLEIEFVAPSFKLGGATHARPGRLFLPAHGIELGVGRPVPYAERSSMPGIVLIDEHLRDGPGGLMALFMHMRASLEEVGISTEGLAGIRPYPDLVRPTPPEKPWERAAPPGDA